MLEVCEFCGTPKVQGELCLKCLNNEEEGGD